jgi:hypothetical protein
VRLQVHAQLRSPGHQRLRLGQGDVENAFSHSDPARRNWSASVVLPAPGTPSIRYRRRRVRPPARMGDREWGNNRSRCAKQDCVEGTGHPSMGVMLAPAAPTVQRPSECPFCKRRLIDTLAKVINESTHWRCVSCNGTWTIASLSAKTRQLR